MLEVVQKIIRGRTKVMVLEPEMRKGEGYGAFALRDMTGDRESRKVFEKRLT